MVIAMRLLKDGWATAKNLLLFAYVFAGRESRKTWRANFNRDEYVRSYADMSQWPYSPALHYLIFGNRDLRDPSSRFDTRFYLARNPDVAHSGMNALAHFAAFGKREGRVLPAMFQGASASDVTSPVIPTPNEPWPGGRPLVSIVIPCYNQGEFIEATLHSALAQTFSGIEIIVVEGGSNDGVTPAKIRQLEAMNPDVRFLYRTERHFVGDNRNFGIAAARGRYICCLDSDDLLDPAYIEVAVFLAEALGYGVVYSTVKRLGTSEVIWRVKDTTLGQIFYDNQIPVPGFFAAPTGNWWRATAIGDTVKITCPRTGISGFASWALAAPPEPSRSPSCVQNQRGRHDRPNSPRRGGDREAASGVEFFTVRSSEGCGSSHQGRPAIPEFRRAARSRPERVVRAALPHLRGSRNLVSSVADWAKEAGWTPLAVTTLDLPEMPKDSACFAGVTDRVYPLATLFRSNEERVAFVQYLIQHYRVRVLVLGGSEAAYHWLPALRASHPELAIVDHLFNSDTHIYNNHHYRNSIDATVVQSERVLQDIQRQLGEPAGEVRRIPLGVEIPGERILDRSGEEITIGYFGRLSAEKGPDLFVQIAKRLAARHAGMHPSLRFILAGDGPERATVHRLARGAESFIEMPGFVKEVRSLMAAPISSCSLRGSTACRPRCWRRRLWG